MKQFFSSNAIIYFTSICVGIAGLSSCSIDSTRHASGDATPQPGLAISKLDQTLRIARNRSLTFEVQIQRSSFEDDVELSFEQLPDGVTATPMVLSERANSGFVEIHASNAATIGMHSVVLKAVGNSITQTTPLQLQINESPGILNPQFGKGGVYFQQAGLDHSIANGVALQADGKIVLVGTSFNFGKRFTVVTRHNQNGSSDSSFATNGSLLLTMRNNNNEGNAVVVQPDQKIVIGGLYENPSSQLFMHRILSDGSIDSSFGSQSNGITLFGTSSASKLTALALTSNGNVIAGGTYDHNSQSSQGLVTSVKNNQIDPSFNPVSWLPGYRLFSYSTTSQNMSTVSAVAELSDGSFIAVGNISLPLMSSIGLVRLNSIGQIDSYFGGNKGFQLVEPVADNTSHANAILAQPKGTFVVAGRCGSKACLLGFLPSGILDSSFGLGGISIANFGTNSMYNALARQPDGKIIAVGYKLVGDQKKFLVARHESNGFVDSSFGDQGHAAFVFSSYAKQPEDIATGVAIQPDGRIVVVGSSSVGAYSDENPQLKYQQVLAEFLP